MKHFGGGLRPPPNRHSVVANMFVPTFAATSKTTFGGGRRVHCVLCLLFNLRPKLPSRCVALGSWSIYFFGCCLVNYCGGLIRWILWHTVVHLGRSTMPGWYRACQIGRSEQQVHLQHFVAFGVQGAGLAPAFLCPVCSTSWLGSSWVGPIFQ